MKKIFLIVGLITSITAYASSWSTHIATVNNHKLHYYQAGYGEPLFLLTGFATTSNFWNKNFVDCLAKSYTVYLVDYWGINTDEDVNGNTTISEMADDVSALSQKLLVKKIPFYVGWSMGGAVVQQISFNNPKMIYKSVLISPLTIHNLLPPSSNLKQILQQLKTPDDILDFVFNRNLFAYSTKQLSQYQNTLFDKSRQLFPKEKIIANQSLAKKNWMSDPKTLLASKSSQTNYLFLISGRDKILSTTQTLSDAKLFSNRKIVKFPDSGHNISMQSPNQVCWQIKNFFEN